MDNHRQTFRPNPFWNGLLPMLSHDRPYSAEKRMAVVCHTPGVLRHVELDGQAFVKGKRVTGFSNTEEAVVGLTWCAFR